MVAKQRSVTEIEGRRVARGRCWAGAGIGTVDSDRPVRYGEGAGMPMSCRVVVFASWVRHEKAEMG